MRSLYRTIALSTDRDLEFRDISSASGWSQEYYPVQDRICAIIVGSFGPRRDNDLLDVVGMIVDMGCRAPVILTSSRDKLVALLASVLPPAQVRICSKPEVSKILELVPSPG